MLRIDVLVRFDSEGWSSSRHEGLDARTNLPSIMASLDLAEVFEGIDFDAA